MRANLSAANPLARLAPHSGLGSPRPDRAPEHAKDHALNCPKDILRRCKALFSW